MYKLIPQSFFSIKWKAALLFGTMLLLFNTLFPMLVYWNLQQKFEFSRDQIQQQFQQELIGQLKTTSEQIHRMAEMSLIPHDGATKSILALLDKHQIQLELDWNITQAQLFDNSAEQLGGWGRELPLAIQNLIVEVLQNEQPRQFIDCSQGCKQYDLIPVLNNGQVGNVLLLAYDMSSSLLEFANKTAADVAILTAEITKNSSNERLLPDWNMDVSAITSYHKNMDYLQTISQNYAFETVHQKNKIFRDSSLPIELNIVSLDNNIQIIFIIIDDIDKQQQEIITITLLNIGIALLGLLVFGGGLFFFISKPLSRLSTVSEALPLLAKQQYQHVKDLVSIENKPLRADELDQLEVSTHELTTQLEELHHSVKERSEALHSRSIELLQERDFVRSLIDTAQLIIITIDRDGNITSFNDFAEKITGYSERNLLNSPFQSLFPEQQWLEVEPTLTYLKENPRAVSQQESEFINHDRSIHIISWLHSSLEHPTDESVVLSVGLDITEKKQTEQQIIWLADHDALTRLYNRRKFAIEFEHILNQAIRSELKGSLLFLDLDQFKDINDSCGHKEGDQILKQVAQALLSITRTTDVVARLGGDEFAIILPGTGTEGAITLAEKVSEQLALLELNFNDIRYKITSSLGIIQFPMSDLSIEELMSNADLAMYQAKARGKNTWHQFTLDDKTRAQLETRVLWKQKIEDALENNKFVLYYQPIMDIRSRTVSHYEVLLRMQNDDGSISPPGTFIQVAEQTGLIHSIDHFVLQQGILKQAELDNENNNVSLSLNLSGYAIDDTMLLPLLKRLLSESKANPEHLIFELTETAAVADILQAKELMTQMNTLGCRFSLDDFGTGFASFRYMRELPVDIVKIDGSFITDLARNPDDQLFVKALVDVAKGMGKKTIAEFVENAETLALLHAFGVDYAQGYYIGKPQPELLDGPPELK